MINDIGPWFDVICGDCREVLPEIEHLVDAVVTDPPYGLSFMGASWDHAVPDAGYWCAVLRAMKPGAHLLAFGGTRTYHRLVSAIEDAGFEIRDSLQWLYGSGFPKSLDVGKAIVKASTDAAKQWDGWGTALKPAHEPIVLARKPLIGTVAANILEHGVGGLNIGASRVGTEDIAIHGYKGDSYSQSYKSKGGSLVAGTNKVVTGRWPANVILSHHDDCALQGTKLVKSQNPKYAEDEKGQGGFQKGWKGRPKGKGIGYADPDGNETVEEWDCHPDCPVRILDEQSGDRSSPWVGNPNVGKKGGAMFGGSQQTITTKPEYRDSGGASRFFYQAKAAKKEKQAGCENLYWKRKSKTEWERATKEEWEALDDKERRQGNIHVTVKPLALMRYLVALITPPGGTVLDPFMGSGSTGVAALQEGFSFIGIDIDPNNATIAEQRINALEPEPED